MRRLIHIFLAGAIALSLPATAQVIGITPEMTKSITTAQAAFDAGKWNDAAAAYDDYLVRFPSTAYSTAAEFGAAVSRSKLARYQEARTALRHFVERHPTSKLIRRATVELAYSEFRLGAVQDAAQILKPVATLLTPEEKQAEAAPLAAMNPVKAADATPSASATLDQLRLIIADVKANKPGAVDSLELALDVQASFLDVARLYAEGDVTSPAFGHIAAKMARAALHIGDMDKAKEAAEKAMQAGAGGHTDQMKDILDRISRLAVVDSKAVGVILPLSGKYKGFGDELQQVLPMAFDPKDNIRLVVRDSQGDPALAVAAVDEMAKEGVLAIIGPIGAGEAIPAAVRAQELAIPMISLSRAEGVTEIGPFIFRNSLTNSGQGKVLAKYATVVLGAKRAAILAPDIPAGKEVSDPFWETVESGGSEVSSYETYFHDQTTFNEPLGRLIAHRADKDALKTAIEHAKATITSAYRQKKAIEKLMRSAPPIIDFDVLLIPDHYRSVLQIAPALRAADVITDGCDESDMERVKKTMKTDEVKTVTLLGTAGWDSPDLIARVGRYVQCAVFVDGFYVNSEREPTKNFVAAFHEKYPSAEPDPLQQHPDLLQAQAYDTARMVRDIIVNHPALTRDGFRQELGNVRKFPGATGETTIAPDREADKPLYFLQVWKTGFVELPVQISPEGIAAAAVPPAPAP